MDRVKLAHDTNTLILLHAQVGVWAQRQTHHENRKTNQEERTQDPERSCLRAAATRKESGGGGQGPGRRGARE